MILILILIVNEFGLGARTTGPGAATELTRTKGVLGYYEICSRVWEHKTAWYKSKTKTGYASDKQGERVIFLIKRFRHFQLTTFDLYFFKETF